MVSSVILEFLPLFFLLVLQFVSDIYIPHLELNISKWWFLIISQIFIIFFFIFEPSKKYYPSHLMKLAGKLLPGEIVILVVFSQYHFAISATIITICVFLPLVLYLLLRIFVEKDLKRNKTIKKKCKKISVGTTIAFCVSLLLPTTISGAYLLITDKPLVQPTVDAVSIVENSDQLINMNIDKIRMLQEDKWPTLNTEQKIDILQTVINVETSYLGINPLKISSRKLEEYTLGNYDVVTNSINIDYDYLSTSTANECLKTVCHETRHAYQDSVIENFDWDNKKSRTGLLYNEVVEWKASMARDEDDLSYNEYYYSSIEIDARSYAIKRVETYEHCIIKGDDLGF